MEKRQRGRPKKLVIEPRVFKKPAVYQIRLKNDTLVFFTGLLGTEHSASKLISEMVEKMRYYYEMKPEILHKFYGVDFYRKYFKNVTDE